MCRNTNLILTFKIVLIAAITALNLTAKAQYSGYNSADSSSYFFTFFSQQVDSLNNSFLAENINIVKIEQKKGDSARESGLFDEYLSLRSDEINSFFEENKNQLSKGLAIYQIHKPIFEKIIVKNGLPKEIAALSFALTSMNPKARSYTGGAGFWQLNYSIARRYNLLIDSYVDERLDPIKSTEAFAKYCNDLYKIYNDWGLVIAAYTNGPSNLNKAIRRAAPSTDINSIKKYLPFFSRDAVDAFVAARNFIQNNSIEYHYLIPQDNDTIEVFKRLHFEQIHAVLQIDKDLIRTLNPIFPHDIVPAVRKSYSLKLPKGSLAKFNLLEDSIYKYKDSLLFRLQPRVVLPPPQADRYWTKRDDNSPPADTKLIYYTIKSGDNLGMIAQKYNVKVSDLEDWNNIYDPRRIQIGKKLKIYVSKSSNSNSSNTESASRNQNNESENQELTDGYFWHTVQAGESPYMIAKKYPGVSADDILRWNNISDARKIQAGQKLKIKKL